MLSNKDMNISQQYIVISVNLGKVHGIFPKLGDIRTISLKTEANAA